MKIYKVCIIKNKAIFKLLLLGLIAFFYLDYSFAGFLLQDEIQISGTIMDAVSNEPLPGVTIIIKGTSTGTITDVEGKFSILVQSGQTLKFSYIGYLAEEVVVDQQTEISISMAPDLIGLEEIVVTGYGVQKKSDLTGAISSVSGENVNKIPVSSLDQALQGMAAGVVVVPKTGRPGSSVNIQIRGITSINGTNPKIVIDGVSQDENAMNRINPADVASIEILKDASSAAIYGASGGNGVILITTKTGQSGKLRTTYDSYFGWEKPIRQLEMMNSQQWMELLEEMSAGSTPYTTQPDSLPTYNWQDIIFQTSFSQNHNLSISGGNDRSNFLFSANYSKENGIIKSTDIQRFNVRLNSEHKLTKRITFEPKISYSNTRTLGFEDWEYEGYYQNPVMPTLQMVPYLPAYDEEGNWSYNYDFGGGTNPLVALDMKDRTRKSDNLEGNFGLIIEPLKGLSYTSRFTAGFGFGDNKEYLGTYWASPTDSRIRNELVQSMDRSKSWNFQNIITYNFGIQNHNFSVMAGMEAGRWWGYDVNGRRVSFNSEIPEMLYLSMSSDDTLNIQIIEGRGYEGRSYRYFGRINYDYRGKYLLTANISRDYSSDFGPENRAGTFPSFSVGWKFSEEAFMQNQEILNFGKIRFGWGVTGANAPSDFAYLTKIRYPNTFKYSFNNDISLQGAGPVQVSNPGLKWEEVKMSNIGLDLSFFDYRLNITAEYFIKINDGMIMEQNVPYVAGTWSMGEYFDEDPTNPLVNIGSVMNKGFELTVGHKNSVGDLKYSVDAYLSIVRNKVLELATDSMFNGAAHNVSPVTLTCEGSPISTFYGYVTDGLFQETDPTIEDGIYTIITNQPYSVNTNDDIVYMQPAAVPGDVRYKDINGDGILNSDDRVDLGSPLPKFTFSLNINLEYKGFDLNMLLTGSYGNKVFNGTKQYLYYSQGNGNRLAAFANRYKDEIVKDGFVVVNENHNTDLPRFAAANYTKMSDFYIEDGSFIRLRSIQLGYTIPNAFSQRVGIDRLRFYVGARNLFTITSYEAFNPEVTSSDPLIMGIDLGTYPITRMYLCGVNLAF